MTPNPPHADPEPAPDSSQIQVRVWLPRDVCEALERRGHAVYKSRGRYIRDLLIENHQKTLDRTDDV